MKRLARLVAVSNRVRSVLKCSRGQRQLLQKPL